MAFRLFVYGTLKRGGRYHDRYCFGAASIQPATLFGRLYGVPDGYPSLEIPPEACLESASPDVAMDARVQERHPDQTGLLPKPPGDWDVVHGEIAEFLNPVQSIPPIDRLEEFEIGRSENLFERRLTLVQVGGTILPAWVYVAHPCLLNSALRIRGGRWP